MTFTPAPASTWCVLIVDDDEDVCESLRDLVELAGCAATTAQSGRAALAVLSSEKPCLIVLDLLMPGMSGAELIEEIRRDPRLADIPLLLSTSAPEQAPDGVPVLPKPIDVHLFCDWVRRSCHRAA